jgi:integrase
MPVLTVASVQRYRGQSSRYEVSDTRAPGLRLIIQPSGAKSWAMRFRRIGGRTAKLTLGPVDLSNKETSDEPVLGGPLTLRQARQLAATIDRERARGVDVVEEMKATKLRKRAEIKERTENTFGVAVREFFGDHKTKWHTRPRRWWGEAPMLGLRWPRDADPAATPPQIIKGGLADIWGDKPLTSFDGHDIHSVVAEARKLGIPGLAKRNNGMSESRGRKMHAALNIFFRWAVRQRRVAANPCSGVWHPGAPPARDRVLSDPEIRAFWLATDKVGQPFAPVLKLLLLTGCRLGEVAGMRRDELGADGIWTIPGTRTKNHRQHVVPLPPMVQEIIATAPRVEGSYVFTTTGTSPISGWSKCKRELDEQMSAGVPSWRLHDLRRTCASGMQRLGVRTEVVERALNHVSGSYGGVAGIYQRDPLHEETSAAMLRWSQHVQGLVSGKPTKVVALRP